MTKHLKNHHSTHHIPPNLDASAAINSARPRMAQGKPPNFYTLNLFCGESLTFPRGRPSIRVLVRRIEALKYSVEVYPFPNDNIDFFPDEDRIIVIKIGDTSLRIIPIPFTRIQETATMEETRIALVTETLRQLIHEISFWDKAVRRAIRGMFTGITRVSAI